MSIHRRGDFVCIIAYLLLFFLPLVLLPESSWLFAQEQAVDNLMDEEKGVVLAHVRVETEPPGAQLYFDGELVGLTPFLLTNVATGEHKLKVVKEDYKAQEQSLIAKEGEVRILSIELEKKEEKKPVIAMTPPEKKPEAKKSKTWLWLLIGGAAAAVVAILATRGDKETAGPAPTTQAFGSIQVKSYPNGAAIFLDGQNTGFRTNHTLTNVTIGRHTILLRLAGWKDWQEEVTVNRDQTAVVKPCLLPPNGCFRDNFQDGDSDGWNLGGGWKLDKEGENYLLECRQSNEYTFAEPATEEWQNYKVTCKVKVVKWDFEMKGITIDVRNSNKGYYRITIGKSGCSIYKHDPEGRITYNVNNSNGIRSGAWINIEVLINENNIQIFADNVLILNFNDPYARLKKGGFRFRIDSEGHAKVDNIIITSDECL